MSIPVFRFAPSPNGFLHLGHAYSALKNHELARESGGRLLLRMEDIDLARCSRAFEQAIFEDLSWLGIDWEQPVRRQSEHFEAYEAALNRLKDENLIYRARLSRREIKEFARQFPGPGSWPSDPDGAPLYPPEDKILEEEERRRRASGDCPFAWRLHMKEALKQVSPPLAWDEYGQGPKGESGTVTADPAAWGDVVLARKDVPTSYHLAVTLDDAEQGITDVVRGRDLFWSTGVHRLLQELLGLPVPRYCHHDLIVDENGSKLSKSARDTSIRSLRADGASVADIRRLVGLGP